MMLNRRLGGTTTSDSTAAILTPRSVSRAQYHSALYSHPQFQRFPANRLSKSSLTFDTAYSQYENTSPRRTRHSDDVVLPPVGPKAPIKTPTPTRRPFKRGSRKLPTVRTSGTKRIAWYHADGSINLQALSYLATKHSCPRTQSYLDRLEKLKSRPWPSKERSQSPRRPDSERLIPLRFVDDDQLSPRNRAEGESLLNILLTTDDLTDQELEQIVRYFSNQPDAESTPRSILRKTPSPRPDSSAEKKKKRSRESRERSERSKSVRFRNASSSAGTEAAGSNLAESLRPHSAPSPHTEFSAPPLIVPHRSSDPFHVASPVSSPRALSSPDEVAYFRDCESPPNIPASPEPISEPKITYYDDSGEEIEEEIETRDQASEASKAEDKAALSEDTASCPDESPPSESGRHLASPGSEADPPEHLPNLDTPRVNRDTGDTQETPRSQIHSTGSTSPHPQGHSVSDTSISSLQTPREAIPKEDTPEEQKNANSPPTKDECADSPPSKNELANSPPSKDECTNAPPCLDKELQTSPEEAKPNTEEKENPSSPPTQTPRPDSAPTEHSTRPNRKSHSKSSKRPKSSRSGSRSANRSTSPKDKSRKDKSAEKSSQKSQDASPTTRPPPQRPEPAAEEPLPIPVISVTRGQLTAVPPYSPRIRSADILEPEPKDRTDSVEGQLHSPRSSTLQGVESSHDSPRGKDNRMKIWLTRTAWNRPVECPD